MRKIDPVVVFSVLIAIFLAVLIFIPMGTFEPTVGQTLGGAEKCGWSRDADTIPYPECDYYMNDWIRVTHIESPTGSLIGCSVSVERLPEIGNFHWLTCDAGFGQSNWRVSEAFNGLVIWVLPDGLKLSL